MRCDASVLLVLFVCGCDAFSIRDLIRGGKRGEDSASTPCPTWHPFECPSGECVPIKYLCDGSPDCSDEYDENKSMCTAAVRPPVEETAAFLKALMAAHGKDFLTKVFGAAAKEELKEMGGVDRVAVALSQSPTADVFAKEVGMTDEDMEKMVNVMNGILNGSSEQLTPNEAADFRFFIQKLQKLVVLLALVGYTAAYGVRLQAIRSQVEVADAEVASKLSGLELVDYVNSAQNLFKTKLGPYFAQFPDATKMKLMGVLNTKVSDQDRENERSYPNIEDSSIPIAFDSRQQWPMCPSMNNIRDQSACGSCWAFAAAESMSDRICIKSNGQQQVTVSADDILTCCGSACGDGCNGGYPLKAWQHYVKEGYVTGGNYTSKSGCKPYPFPPCEHHNNATRFNPCPGTLYPTGKCERTCQAGYSTAYNQDKHYGSTAYAVSRKVSEIQKEIMTNGPVEVSFTVYEDFEHYTGGIYVHTGGQMLGGHAVKMIGWGQENGTPYWICANSWNTDWGEKGFFRIISGVDECGIESGVVAGEPKL